jgi:hypothetical protein
MSRRFSLRIERKITEVIAASGRRIVAPTITISA